jgi:hypothetical protein
MNDIVLAASDELRAAFDYRVDRWGHRIEVRREDQWVAAFSSIEGSAADDWPPSPTFQHIHLQSFSISGPTALLVGKAGESHWSAAIEADREAGVLRFDIACRLAGERSVLGSAYLFADEPEGAVPCRPRLEISAINDECRRDLELGTDQLSIRVVTDSTVAPRTVRWKYVVRPSW